MVTMTPPRNGEKDGENTRRFIVVHVMEKRCTREQATYYVERYPGERLTMLTDPDVLAESLAAKDAEIAKLRADLAVVRHGIGEPAAMTPALMAVEMQRLRLANVELRRTAEASCAWHGPYTGERTPCCVHQAKLKETP